MRRHSPMRSCACTRTRRCGRRSAATAWTTSHGISRSIRRATRCGGVLSPPAAGQAPPPHRSDEGPSDLKVNLSMAHGQPVVSTPCAVEGMHLRDGHDVLVADDAAAFADAVVRLHEDEALWTTLSRNGLDNVARHFSLDAARDTVRRVFFAPRG